MRAAAAITWAGAWEVRGDDDGSLGGIGVFQIDADGSLVMTQNPEGVLPGTTFAIDLLAGPLMRPAARASLTVRIGLTRRAQRRRPRQASSCTYHVFIGENGDPAQCGRRESEAGSPAFEEDRDGSRFRSSRGYPDRIRAGPYDLRWPVRYSEAGAMRTAVQPAVED
jgi:hypothetical protein